MFKYIKAMAYDKQTIMNDLMNKSQPLTDHLIKLYLFPSTEYAAHWRHEVWSFLNRIPKMKSTGKLPSKDLIYSGISGYLDTSDNLMYLMMSEYDSSVPERTDIDELEAILADYFDWVSTKLSKDGVVVSKEVYKKLDELGL